MWRHWEILSWSRAILACYRSLVWLCVSQSPPDCARSKEAVSLRLFSKRGFHQGCRCQMLSRVCFLWVRFSLVWRLNRWCANSLLQLRDLAAFWLQIVLPCFSAWSSTHRLSSWSQWSGPLVVRYACSSRPTTSSGLLLAHSWASWLDHMTLLSSFPSHLPRQSGNLYRLKMALMPFLNWWRLLPFAWSNPSCSWWFWETWWTAQNCESIHPLSQSHSLSPWNLSKLCWMNRSSRLWENTDCRHQDFSRSSIHFWVLNSPNQPSCSTIDQIRC